jgi:mycothiol synthase
VTATIDPSPPDLPPGRPLRDAADLRAMQAALSASWRVAGPLVNTTPGDLEWWIASLAPGDDPRRRVQLWTEGDDVLAYAWFNPPADLDWHQRADLPAQRRAVLVDAAIAWAEARARADAAAGGIGLPPTLETWAMDADRDLGKLLVTRGFSAAAEPAYTHWYAALGPGRAPVPPGVPRGYRMRHVRVPEDLEARVEVHRAAFAPSRLTVDKYRALLAMRHYAPERDLVVEAPDGSLAAFALVWWLPDAGVGEFEPVGTHPAHRQRGLGRALMVHGLRSLHEVGARGALVFSRTSNEASEGLYRSVGFAALTHHRPWTRPLRPGAQ